MFSNLLFRRISIAGSCLIIAVHAEHAPSILLVGRMVPSVMWNGSRSQTAASVGFLQCFCLLPMERQRNVVGQRLEAKKWPHNQVLHLIEASVAFYVMTLDNCFWHSLDIVFIHWKFYKKKADQCVIMYLGNMYVYTHTSMYITTI